MKLSHRRGRKLTHKDDTMKTILITAIMLASANATALGYKTSEWTSGMNKYCKYSNGTIITISVASLCPLSV